MKTLKQFKEEYQIDERYDKDLDADGNGKLTKNDFKLLRAKKKKSDCMEGTDKPCSPYFTDSKGIKRKQPNDPFYPEFDKPEQGKTSDAKKAKFAKLGLKAEEVELDESFLSNTSSTHPTLAGKLNKLRSIHKTLTTAGYSTNNKDHLSQDSNHMGNPNSNTVTYKKSGTADVTINHGGSANPKTLYSVKSSKGAGKKVNLPEETELDEDCGAYETWDPKHPKFVANYKKYQSDNANLGSIKDFIDKEKAKPRRLPK